MTPAFAVTMACSHRRITLLSQGLLRSNACRNVPVYMGAQGQLLGEPMQPCDFHGTDGMGDAPDADPPASSIHVRLAPGVPLLLEGVGIFRALLQSSNFLIRVSHRRHLTLIVRLEAGCFMYHSLQPIRLINYQAIF